MIGSATLLLLILLGAIAALDHTSVGQFMLSRPLVAGTFAGLLLGDPQLGFLLGALLEGMFIAELPAGGVRVAEPGPAAVSGVAAALLLGGAGGLAVGMALGVVFAWLGGWSVEVQRRWNARHLFGKAPGDAERSGVELRHLSCIVTDAARGVFLTAVGLLCAHLLPAEVASRWPLERSHTLLLLSLPAALAAGSLLRRWAPSALRGTGLFAAGAVAALLIGFLR